MKSGKRISRAIGGCLCLLGMTALFILMANQEQIPRATLWGLLALSIGVCGMLLALDPRQANEDPVVSMSSPPWARQPEEPRWTTPMATVPVALLLLAGLGFGLGFSGLPWAIVAALAALLPSAARRPGLLVFIIASALYLPFLGAYSLWDPWETHYGEVAREILSRDDWISLWWAQDGWFWSKPILIFWSSALTWDAMGIPYRPDNFPTYVEWALRLPIYFMTIGALLAVYAAIARFFTRRAAVISALVIATMPHFFFMAHQAITDMPFVAFLIIAMALLLLAIGEDPEREVDYHRIGPFFLSAQQLVMALVSALCLPQIIYLATRNVTMIPGPLFVWHLDRFVSGSAGNKGVPGNAAAQEAQPYIKALWAQPISQALVWFIGFSILIWMLRRERRAQPLYMFAFYIFCALSFMAKGLPGVALPGVIALLFLLVSNQWSLLLLGRLRVAAGMLVVAVVGMPWFVAMYIRHGLGFTDRLLIHDHINRLAAGVHGDTGSIQYFLAQLGYGIFPWLALAPAALTVWWLWQAQDGDEPEKRRMRREVIQLLALWFAAGFTLFSAMITKFHHYIFPAEPPLGILIGLALDRMLGDAAEDISMKRVVGATAAVALAPTLWVLGVAGLLGDVRGVAPDGLPPGERAGWVLGHPWPLTTSVLLLLAGAALVAASVKWRRPPPEPRTADAARFDPAAILGAALAGGAVLCAFVARDLSYTTAGRPMGYERLIHLFVYNYGRPWPQHFDYRPILTGFAVVATACVTASVARTLRPWAIRALLGTALAFSIWCLDVYMIDLSPHWGQRELIERYYRERKGPREPLVAWQMNWKGENLYSGNRVAVFVNLKDEDLLNWIDKRKGVRAFFVLEHTRLPRFRTILKTRTVREITTERENNKFILVSAQL